MIEKNTLDCGCEITVYGDGSAPPEIEYCDLHDILSLAGQGNERLAKARLREMTPAKLRGVREAVQLLDEWLDEIAMERNRIARKKNGD